MDFFSRFLTKSGQIIHYEIVFQYYIREDGYLVCLQLSFSSDNDRRGISNTIIYRMRRLLHNQSVEGRIFASSNVYISRSF